MKLIAPVAITDAILDSNNVAETEHSAWNSGTTYADGDFAIKSHRIWESVAGSNLNNDPDTDDGTWWIDTGPTNAWAMFDDKVYTTTSNASSIVVAITPGELVNAVALMGLGASTVQVVVDDPTDGEVYNKTIDLTDYSPIVDWYTYFFAELDISTTAIFDDLPAYGSATITITITASAGNADCAVLVIGKVAEVGAAAYGTSLGITDYSRKEVDEFGNVDILERNYSDTGDFDLEVYTSKISRVKKLLTRYRATPVVWVGVDDREETVIYGFYRDFRITIAGPILSSATLEIEGLI